jgi:glutathione synthase
MAFMSLNIALQIDPPHTLKHAVDSSMVLARAALARGHKLFYLPPESVSMLGGEVMGSLSALDVYAVNATPAFTLGVSQFSSLAKINVILIRQDPPFDMAYITNTMLLEHLEAKGALVLNRPASVRNYPEKLLPLEFTEFTPPTLISRDIEQIHAFYRAHSEVVIKPLYAYGGRGVFKLGKNGENVEALLEMMLSNSREPLVVQKFLAEVSAEEKRIILVNGELAGAFGRIPAKGDIRANMRVGGSAVKTELSARQQEIAAGVGARCKQLGLLLVGLDVIGDWLTEVNVTSPTGLMQLKTLYGTAPDAMFWEAVEMMHRC